MIEPLASASPPAAMLAPLPAKPPTDPAQGVAWAARQFESIFVRQIIEDALEPMIEGALPEDGAGAGVYRYFLADSLAQSVSGQLGLSSVLQAQLQPPPAFVPST